MVGLDLGSQQTKIERDRGNIQMLSSHRFLVKLTIVSIVILFMLSVGCSQKAATPQEQPTSEESVGPLESTGLEQQNNTYKPEDVYRELTISNMLPENGSKTKETDITISAIIDVPNPEEEIIVNMEVVGRDRNHGAQVDKTFRGASRYYFEYTFDAEPDTYIVRLSAKGSYLAGSAYEEWEFGAGVRKYCQVMALNNAWEEVDPNDPTAYMVFNGITLPLGEDWSLTPDSPELPSNFKWSGTSHSSDADDDRHFSIKIFLVGADETQYEEMTYDVSITFSYHLTATGSQNEWAKAFMYCGAYQFNQDQYPAESLFHRNESISADEEIAATVEQSDTVTETHQLTLKDCWGVQIDVKLETEHEGSGSSEATLAFVQISLTRVN